MDYFRGWKGSASRNPYFQKLDRKSRGPASRRGLLIRLLGGFFSGLFALGRWFFRQKGFWRKLLYLGVAGALLGFIVFGSLYAYYSFTLPDPSRLADRHVAESTKILDRNGKLLYEIHGEAKRTLIPLDQVQSFTKQATIAVEDKDFYRHGGISFSGIARALLVNIFSGARRQGGSTITQQFVRNAVLTREKTYARKIKEIIISQQLEQKYTKDEILQLYLNEIPYGSNAYGIEAAAQTFFGKNAKDLTLLESAYLAALPQAPTYYSPYGPNKEALDNRADTVLGLMYEQGYINKDQKNRAQAEKVNFRNIGNGILAPHFVLYVQDLLAKKYGEVSLREGGFKVTTTLDLDLQTKAEAAVAKQIPFNEKNYNATNASLVALDPRSGQILAMVGSRDYFDKEHDGAVNVTLRPRQPGSSFKPYVYATAFKLGMNPASLLFDVVTNFGEFGGKEYTPQDYDGGERGPVSIRQALQGSLNIPAVKTLILVGINNALDTAENLGITTLKDRSRYGPSLVLGGGEVTLLEHTTAFGVFANGGVKQEVTPILKIEDKNGNVLEEYKESRGKEVLDPQIAYQINNVLSDNEARTYIFGAHNRLVLPGRTAAAKTGTTQEYRDAWTVGYVPSLVAGVWVGNNNNAAMKTKADGSVVAAPIWNDFMREALAGKPTEEFSVPSGISSLEVDSLSGKLPTAYSPATKTEVFASFNAPTESDGVHLPFTSSDETKTYTILHSEKPDDPAWEEPVRAWALAHGYSYPEATAPTNQTDSEVEIKITAPDRVTTLPWPVSATAAPLEKIKTLNLLLDGTILATATGASLEFTSNAARADGTHLLTIEAYTKNGKINRATRNLEFKLDRKLLLLSPQDNAELKFPTNLVLETAVNVAPLQVNFRAKSATGKELLLRGTVTRQQTAGKMFLYTLNWAVENKPLPGSYSLSAQIGGDASNQVVVKIP